MSLKGVNEQIEKLDYRLKTGWDFAHLTKRQRSKYHSHSRKIYKKLHRKWLRNQYKKDPYADIENRFHGWEY